MSLLKDVLEEKAEEVLTEEDLEMQKIAKRAFRTMDHVLDKLESMHERVDSKTMIVDMDKLGLVHERESLAKLIAEAINEFEDFMPGLEMQMRGED